MNDNYILVESKVRDYISLLKPRVMSLVIFTGLTSLYLAPGHINPFLALISIICIAVGSGAAGAVNMWYDRDIDIIMERTKNRPIPGGRVDASYALEFAIILAVASVLIMIVAINFLSALLLLSAILFYVFIYTIWLKRKTPQNIVIGGAAGAFPPLIGWASVTGNLSIEPIILFTIIFIWTPPHFWALSLYKSEDYSRANIPMMPVVRGDKVTKIQMLIYTFLLCIITIGYSFICNKGYVYFISSIILNIKFVELAVKVYLDKLNKNAPKLFGYSIFYLFLIFLMLILDKIFYYKLI